MMLDLSEIKFLIVDDNPDNLRLVADLLIKEKYNIRVVKNGSNAITTITFLARLLNFLKTLVINPREIIIKNAENNPIIDSTVKFGLLHTTLLSNAR